MKHLGDITKLNGAEIPVVDCITGGSPCQDLSVAGKRAGMKHEDHGDEETTRSGLFMDQIRIVKEMREHDRATGRSAGFLRPRYMVWENVPGAFSSNHGRDFQAVLEEIVKVAEPDAPGVPLPEVGRWSKSGVLYDELGRWSVAWRVHDSQWWGVPQRRKRIALLADFNGLTAPEIMFDPQLERTTEDGYPYETEPGSGEESRSEVQLKQQGVSGHSEPGGQAREKVAGGSGEGVEGADRSGCLNQMDDKPDTICLEGNGSRESHFGNGYSESDVMYTLNTIEQHGVLPLAEPIVLESNQNHATVTDDGIPPHPTGIYGHGRRLCPYGDGAPRHIVPGTRREARWGKKGILIQDEHIGALSTLRSEDHGHPPLVMSAAGFSFGQSAKARSLGYQEEVSPTLRGGEGGNQKPCVLDHREYYPLENHPNDSRIKVCEDGVFQTLSSRMGTGGNNTPFVWETDEPLPFDTTQVTCPNNWSAPHPGDPCHPLASTAHPPAIAFTQNQREEVRDLGDTATAIGAETGTHQQTYVATCIGNGQADIASHISEEVAQTLNCMHDQLAVCVDVYNQTIEGDIASTVTAACGGSNTSGPKVAAVDCRNATEDENVNGTLQAKEKGGTSVNLNNTCRTGNVVRRLTPMECERLQMFPDGWTDIGEWVDRDGKKHKEADTPRYKALGNSIALPFWDWLLGRISAQYDYTPTLGSLFSGIGGFDLCWEKHNGKGSARWQSEIEGFPIAVCKKHFGDEDAGIEGDWE